MRSLSHLNVETGTQSLQQIRERVAMAYKYVGHILWSLAMRILGASYLDSSVPSVQDSKVGVTAGLPPGGSSEGAGVRPREALLTQRLQGCEPLEEVGCS